MTKSAGRRTRGTRTVYAQFRQVRRKLFGLVVRIIGVSAVFTKRSWVDEFEFGGNTTAGTAYLADVHRAQNHVSFSIVLFIDTVQNNATLFDATTVFTVQNYGPGRSSAISLSSPLTTYIHPYIYIYIDLPLNPTFTSKFRTGRAYRNTFTTLVSIFRRFTKKYLLEASLINPDTNTVVQYYVILLYTFRYLGKLIRVAYIYK